MKRINLPLLADTLFFAFCAFLLSFATLRYYTKNVTLSIILGIFCALLFGAAIFAYIKKRQVGKYLTHKQEKERRALAMHLSLCSEEYVSLLFLKCFGENARLRGSEVEHENTLFFFVFKMAMLCEDDIANVIKCKYDGTKCIYCNKISAEAKVLADDFGVHICTIDDVFTLLKKQNLLPEKYVYGEKDKKRAFTKIKERFNRKLCLPLFWSGAGLLFLSFFTFFPIYYIISGSLLICLCMVTLVFGK